MLNRKRIPWTKLHNVAYANDLLTVFYGGGNKLYADSAVRTRLSMVLRDVIKRYNVNPKVHRRRSRMSAMDQGLGRGQMSTVNPYIGQ